MRYLPALALPALLLCGCQNHDDGKINALEARLVAAETRAESEKQSREKLESDLYALSDQVARTRKTAPVEAGGLTREELKREIADAMEALRKELAQAKGTQPGGGETAKTEAPKEKDAPKEKTEAEKTKEIEEAKAKLADKLSRFYANLGDPVLTDEVYELLWQADAKARKDVVDKLKAMVAENPEDKHLRLALANAMMTQFRDARQAMEQGILAGNIMKEAKKAEQIDPEFYDAIAFIAVYKANYPEGFVEFNEAWKDLDKALAMQAKMAWEERFGDIYVAYAQWHYKQKKYDEALAKAQEGLDKDVRNQKLIDLKKKIEDAKK